MNLVLSKFNFNDLKTNKYLRMTSYVALAICFMLLAIALNDVFAITEASLNDTAAMGVDGSGQVLNTPVLWTIRFLEGTGGLFATVLAFCLALYSAIFAKSLMGIILAIGIAIAAVFGPAILMSVFGAII